MSNKKHTKGYEIVQEQLVAKRGLTAKQKAAIIVSVAVVLVVALTLTLVLGYFSGWFGGLYALHKYNRKLYNIKKIANEDLSVHFLGSSGLNGDCIYVKAGDTDILIDAGPDEESANSIHQYIRRYCRDGVLEYVVVTHGDRDHISGFFGKKSAPGIFERYVCKTIIECPRRNKATQHYYNYCVARNQEIVDGAKCYTALECYNNENGAKRVYELGKGITMEILYQEYYEKYTDTENDYSVCLTLNVGDIHCLLTGDLQKSGEESLVKCNPDLPQMTLYKGAHHGSFTSSNDVLLSKIRPEYVCVCCVAGSVEYRQESENTFPTQAFIDRIAPYTDKVYVTSVATVERDEQTGLLHNVACNQFNGDIVFACTDGNVHMYFSNSDTKLKDTAWMAANRIMPPSWSNT